MMDSEHLPELDIKAARFEKIIPAIEKYMLLAAVFVVALVIICSLIHALTSRSAFYTGTIRVTVHKGDSLWTYAKEYGDPNEYMLKRVHKIARINSIEVNRPLQPGQELIVPCERKTVCASTNRQMP
jgi:nucleoid-associated protein YgaU